VALGGSTARRGRHVPQGYPVGLLGALSVYCDMHCRVSAGSASVVAGALAGGAAAAAVEAGSWDDENERTLRTVMLMKR